MGFPADFAESNVVLEKPSTMTAEECSALSAFQGLTADGLPVVISCWKLTAEELAEINRTGRVWLLVYGTAMFPSCVAGEKPFVTRELQ